MRVGFGFGSGRVNRVTGQSGHGSKRVTGQNGSFLNGSIGLRVKRVVGQTGRVKRVWPVLPCLVRANMLRTKVDWCSWPCLSLIYFSLVIDWYIQKHIIIVCIWWFQRELGWSNWETSKNWRFKITTVYPWCNGHSTNISVCGVWGPRARIQVSRRELYTHIHLD